MGTKTTFREFVAEAEKEWSGLARYRRGQWTAADEAAQELLANYTTEQLWKSLDLAVEHMIEHCARRGEPPDWSILWEQVAACLQVDAELSGPTLCLQCDGSGRYTVLDQRGRQYSYPCDCELGTRVIG